eukprot:5059400-Pleurochrysis_carterae.AAC.1
MLASAGGSDGLAAKARARERELALRRKRLEYSSNQSCPPDTSLSAGAVSNLTTSCQTLETT